MVLAFGAAQADAETPEAPGSASPRGAAEALTKAKLDADLGRYEEATASLTRLAGSAEAPKALRAEAFVRLGSVRQSAGDPKGSVEAYSRALREHGDDEAAVALLVQAVGGVVPGPDLWKDRWPRLQLGVDVTAPARPSAWIRWPEVAWAERRVLDNSEGRIVRFVRPAALYSGTPISLHFQNGDLGDIFRLFADISGLNVVVNPGTRGFASLRFLDVPWDDALDRILSANGLAYRLNGPVLHIGRLADLGPADQKFTGQAMSLDFQDVDLRKALATIAERGGLRVDAKPKVAGRVTLKLNEVPWDQAFDLLARVNGLQTKRVGQVMTVGLPGE
jgi:tetratricopeptide (TPR) repeat protein